MTVAVCAAGPLALSVIWPRSRKRDVALFALQMWGFMMAHELPYDDPTRLRERLRVRYPVTSDRFLGRGVLPNTRLQRVLSRPGRVTPLDRVLAWAHWVWFLEPYITLLLILARHSGRFPRAARQMAAVFDLGCAVYFAVPTAPPWWAAENGFTGDDEVRRIMIEIGEEALDIGVAAVRQAVSHPYCIDGPHRACRPVDRRQFDDYGSRCRLLADDGRPATDVAAVRAAVRLQAPASRVPQLSRWTTAVRGLFTGWTPAK